MDATRSIMLVGVIGLGAAALLSLPGIMLPAIADEEPMRTVLSTPAEEWPSAFDPDKLVKWSYYIQPGVSIAATGRRGNASRFSTSTMRGSCR